MAHVNSDDLIGLARQLQEEGDPRSLDEILLELISTGVEILP